MATLASLGQANSMDRTIFSEVIPDRIMPDQELPLDALGYLGGLFESRFYQPHATLCLSKSTAARTSIAL